MPGNVNDHQSILKSSDWWSLYNILCFNTNQVPRSCLQKGQEINRKNTTEIKTDAIFSIWLPLFLMFNI